MKSESRPRGVGALPGQPGLVGTATVRVPGTCGELVQGILDGTQFLITCPVNLYSTVHVELYVGSGEVQGPLDCPKATQALRLTLSHFERRDLDARLSVESPIPRSKGMASSTADVSAAIGATARALGRSLSPLEVSRLALAVEPSDGVMFPGIALFDYREGRLYEDLGPPPPIEIVVLDFGGTVDTLEFNSVDRSGVLRAQEADIQDAVHHVRRGIRVGAVSLVGKGATISALSNQSILWNPQLREVEYFSNAVGALGVNVAHSGTVIGILLDGRKGQGQRVYQDACTAFPEIEAAYLQRLVEGGISPT